MFKAYSSLCENIKKKNSLRVFYIENRLYKDITIDIIMPTFNRENSIDASIDSILNQTHIYDQRSKAILRLGAI